MSLVVNRPRVENSPSNINYYKDSSLYTKSETDDSYVYTPGNNQRLAERYLEANPFWRFTNTDYSFEDEEFFPEEESNAVDVFINRILASSAVNNEDDDSFGINNVEDGIVKDMDFPNQPRQILPTFDKKEWKKKMRGARREGKKEKMPAPEVIGPCGLHLPLHTIKGQYANGEESVTMPLSLYRDTVIAEVDSLSRRVYHYYTEELRAFDELRMDAVKDSYLYHEKCTALRRKLDERNAEIRALKAEVATMRHQIEGEQMAKKQRRADKKRRRAQKFASTQQTPAVVNVAPTAYAGEGDTNNS